MAQHDSFAIVVSAAPAPAGQSSNERELMRAKLSEQLVNLKICYQSEAVVDKRAEYARERLFPGMHVFFHQGGSPSVSAVAQQFPQAGRLIAAGYFGSVCSGLSGVPTALLNGEQRIFPGKILSHFVTYKDVKRIPRPLQPLTKDIIGKTPRPGQDFIIIDPADRQYYAKLSKLW